MASFVSIPIETDAGTIEQSIYDGIVERFPSWTPAPGNLETWLVKSLSLMAADLAEVAVDVPAEVFATFGDTVIGLPAQEAVPARGETTWTFADADGHTLPIGTTVALQAAGDVTIGFATLNEVSVLPGDTETEPGEVVIEALEPGVAYNALAGPVTLIDALSYVETVELVSPTFGGQDAELPDEYLDRLVAELQMLTPRPILPPDVETLSRRIDEVYRALAVDGWDAGLGTGGHERTVTVAVTGDDGLPISPEAKAELAELLDGMREINFVFWIVDPTYTTVDVDYSATVVPGYDPTVVAGDIDRQITTFLDPLRWGQSLAESREPHRWHRRDTVRINDLVAVVDNVIGVDFVESVQIAEGGGTLDDADLELAGDVANLTIPGEITGTMHVP